MYTNALFVIFLLCIAIQLGYVLYFFTHIFSLSKKKKSYKPVKPVSVIICAHNEAEQLKANLPSIFAQRYTNDAGNSLFEVIVVNDRSEDETEAVLRDMKSLYSNLRVVEVDKEEERLFPGKKNALHKAVDIARHDILLMTDADCMPASSSWLYLMAQPFHVGKQVVAGYGKYKISSSLLNSFIRWETVHTFLQYSSYAKAGQPYMAVGRNLACTREAFKKAESSVEWPKLPSGDDDLLVRAAGNNENVCVVANPAAFTLTTAKQTIGAYIRQKQRHLSTGKYYKLIVKGLLALYGLSHALMWVSFILLLFTPLWGEVLAMLLLRCIIYWVVWQRVSCILQEKKLIRFFPLFDIGWLVYNFVFSPYIIWKNKQQWI